MAKADGRGLTAHHMSDIRELFADLLAVRLRRTAGDIRKHGLRADDFRTNEAVRLVLCDGSTLSFRYAFAVVDPERRLVGVFTEHCGYYSFGAIDMRMQELRDRKVVRRHSW
jgi:hypothetical protein